MIGKTVGPYQVIAELGRGGMGEVYRARDGRLDRDVAIKILPELFAQDPERLARFEREAKALAALNHPNIAAIYGLEGNALVMELVEGQDLSELIGALGNQGAPRTSGAPGLPARGIPIDETLAIARQIADALEAAHEQGIVHRDLKPGNVKVRADGTVKVLDFGLAKAMDPGGASAVSNASNSPTLTARATQMGMIIGTAAYMSPEQAKGKAVDRRADIWAFGVVLYEMLTGRRAFEGEDISTTLAAVLMKDPEWTALPANTPPALVTLIHRCLERDPKQRLRDIGEARLLLSNPQSMSGRAAVAAPGPGPSRSHVDWRIGVGALALAGVAAAGAWMLKPAPASPRAALAKFAIALPKGLTYTRTTDKVIAISPDGSHIAYIAGAQLFVRALDQLEPVLVAGLRGDPREVFFSSDSRWIGFYVNPKIWKVAVTGGAPIPVCDSLPVLGASWTGDEILFGQDAGIMRVAASGGAPELLIPSEAGRGRLSNPWRVAGSGEVLFSRTTAIGNWDEADIVAAPAGGAERVIVRGGSDARLLPTGHLVYGRRGELLVVPVNTATLAIEGTPVALVSGVPGASAGITAGRQYAISNTGTLVYVSGGAEEETDLVWADRQGREEILITETLASYPRISPDGQRITYSAVAAGNMDVYIYEWARKVRSRLTFDAAQDLAPVWSADSKRIVYASGRNDSVANLYWQPADGTGSAERLTTGPNQQWPYAVSRDGTLIYIELDPKTSFDIHALSLTGDRKPRGLLTSGADERRPTLSPDDKWMAYQSNESGSFEIFVRPFPDMNGGRWQVSAGGGASPLWGADLGEIFFRSGQNIMRAGVSTTPAFVPATPSVLFNSSLMPDAGGIQYALAPDGKRFALMRSHATADARSEYHVVLNWFDEVRARAPRNK